MAAGPCSALAKTRRHDSAQGRFPGAWAEIIRNHVLLQMQANDACNSCYERNAYRAGDGAGAGAGRVAPGAMPVVARGGL
jgi:hypothetical protein